MVYPLTFITFKWGTKYSGKYVSRLASGIARNYHGYFRFICFCDDRGDIPGHIDCRPIADPDLLSISDGCFARLRMFDPAWQRSNQIERLVCLDLDLVITGKLNALFDRPEPFVILHGGHFNPCPYNGSVMMLEAGYSPRIWSGFDIARAFGIAEGDGTFRGSDQTWLSALLPNAPGWTHKDGIYAFHKPGWPRGDNLPEDARIVIFPGAQDPAKLTHLRWVDEHWR